MPGSTPNDDVVAADVVIEEAVVSNTLEGAERVGPTWAFRGDQFLLSVPNVGRFLVQHGRKILVEHAVGAPRTDAIPFLLGGVLAVLLHQRQRFVLRASAVAAGRDAAVLICGSSGTGKSTLAAALALRGHAMIADDVCVLDVGTHDPVRVQPGGPLTLWADAVDAVGYRRMTTSAVRNDIKKYYVNAPHLARDLPVAAMYELREGRQETRSSDITQIGPLQAMASLRRATYFPQLIELFDRSTTHFTNAERLLRQAPLYRLTRRVEFDALAETVDRLEEHWGALGLASHRV